MNVSQLGSGQVRQAGSGRRPGPAPWPAGHMDPSAASSYHCMGAQPQCLSSSWTWLPAAEDMPDMAKADPRDHRSGQPGPE